MHSHQSNYIKEACVGSLEEALAAEKNGADRIELCARLDLGGITPDEQLIKDCLEQLSIPTKVMIRPRGGNFVYDESEAESMIRDIEMCNRLGVVELVAGALTSNHEIDVALMSRLSANVGSVPVTFHKAIDEVSDVKTAIYQLKEIPNIKYILTSGLAETAALGKEKLVEMLAHCGDEIILIAAGRVTNQNVEELHSYVGAKEYHGTKIVG